MSIDESQYEEGCETCKEFSSEMMLFGVEPCDRKGFSLCMSRFGCLLGQRYLFFVNVSPNV